MSMNLLALEVNTVANDKGFWPDHFYEDDRKWWQMPFKKHPRNKITDEALCTKLALIHSEVTEVLEAIRKNKGHAEVVEEMADILIRLLDLYAAMLRTDQVRNSLDSVVQLKHEKNSKRPHKHGNNF